MNKPLVALVSEFAELDRLLIESGGELTPEIEQQFMINRDNMRSKVDRYKLYMDHLDARAVYFKDIADQALAAKRLFENHKSRLKENVKYAMSSMDTTELEGDDWRFKLSAPKDKISIDDKLLPEDFKKTEIIKIPDREAVETALMLGEEIPGVTVEKSYQLRSYINHAGRAKPVKESQ